MDRGISAPGHGREILDGLNTTDKSFLFQLISTVQFMGAKRYDTQMEMHSGTPNSNISLV